MKILISLISVTAFVRCGIVDHEELGLGHEIEHHEGATSYQNIHIEHFHAVPTFIKKEHKHLLEHPIPLGKSSSKVEIHHGNKHNYGYAIANVENDVHGHGGFDEGILEGHQESLASLSGGGHESTYQVHDQGGEEHLQYQGQLEQEQEGLGHYQLPEGYSGHEGLEHLQLQQGALEGHEAR